MHMRHNMCESAHDRPAEPHATPNGRLAHGHLARTRHQPASPCGGRRAEAARAEAAHDCRRAAAGVHGGRSEGETQGEDTSDDDLAGQHDRAEDEGRGRRPRRERRTGRRRIGGGSDEHGGGGNGGGGLAGGGRDDDHVAAPQTTQPARAAQPQALVSTPGLAREGLGEASSHGHAPRRKAGVSALAPAVARGVATLVMLMVAQCFSAIVGSMPARARRGADGASDAEGVERRQRGQSAAARVRDRRQQCPRARGRRTCRLSPTPRVLAEIAFKLTPPWVALMRAGREQILQIPHDAKTWYLQYLQVFPSLANTGANTPTSELRLLLRLCFPAGRPG